MADDLGIMASVELGDDLGIMASFELGSQVDLGIGIMASVEELFNNLDGPIPLDQNNSYINHNWFPNNFLFGTANSAYQVEGAHAEDGKGINSWDDFTMMTPERIDQGTNGVVAADMYHKYKEDIRRMKQMGFNSYRFSLSWTRILPGGRSSAGINKKGIDYYNDVINTVIAHGMEPCVTIFHWDIPHCLEKEYGGFMSSKIQTDFCDYARICFNEFGDRVKLWCTLNEPLTYSVHGYVLGIFPPGKELPDARSHPHKMFTHRRFYVPQAQLKSTSSDRAHPKDAYNVARNLLLSHARAFNLYKHQFKAAQHGQIGLALNTSWCEPLDETDEKASLRAMDFMIGWFLNPVVNGQYPKSMVEYVYPRNLEPFTKEESHLLEHSIDFLGLNYYTAQYVSDDPNGKGEGYTHDQKILFHDYRGSKIIGEQSPGSSWIHSCPWGLYKLLKHIKMTYENLKEIYITENGCSDAYDFTLPANMALNDSYRRKYLQDHLINLVKVMRDTGVNVKGYYICSWCDNFEWNAGYSARFGLVYIDYMNNQTRYPKNSSLWVSKFLRTNQQPLVELPWSTTKVSRKRSSQENEEAKKKSKAVEDAVVEDHHSSA